MVEFRGPYTNHCVSLSIEYPHHGSGMQQEQNFDLSCGTLPQPARLSLETGSPTPGFWKFMCGP